MKHEDLIKKLETLETPEIELPGHKQALKMALLNSGRFKERTIRDWARILAPVTAAVLLIAIAGFFNVIQARLQIAQARGIVMSDLQVQELMEDNELEITEVELRNGEAFVMLAYQVTSVESHPGEDALPALGEGSFSTCNITVSGYILKVNLAEEKVTDFGEVDEITGLRDINLDDIDFAKFEPPKGMAPEEADTSGVNK